MATWPGGLPQSVLRSGFSQARRSGVIRQSMEVGPDKIRKRTSSRYRPMKAEIIMTAAQLQTFFTFFELTIQEGSLPFTWTDPVQSTVETFRFVEPPSWEPYGLDYRVMLDLEMLVVGVTRPLRASDSFQVGVTEDTEILSGNMAIVKQVDDLPINLTEGSAIVAS